VPASTPHRAAAAALLLAACAVAPVGPPPPPAQPPPPPARAVGEPTWILTAHAQPAPPGQRDYFGIPVGGLLYLVFSRPLDPAALAPGRFVVLYDDGTRRVPLSARLAPTSERDELRALELVLAAPVRPILSVTVVGQLFDADVAATTAPPAPVAAERLPSGLAECPGEQVVRVWWSAPVAAGPAPARLQLRGGASLPAARLADLACRPAVRLTDGAACDVADDNVIDFCFAPGDAAAAIELPPDAARDRQGLPSAAGRLELSI
jgi:nitrate reductase NapE component